MTAAKNRICSRARSFTRPQKDMLLNPQEIRNNEKHRRT